MNIELLQAIADTGQTVADSGESVDPVFIYGSTKDIITQSVIIGIVASFIASAIFINLLFLLRPRIKISKHVAVGEWEGRKCYFIKVVNRSYHKMYDVNTELIVMNPVNAAGGKNLRLVRVPLARDRIWYIARRPIFEKLSEYGSHAIIFRTEEDIDNLWSIDGSVLHFKVIAKHGLSGFTKVATMKYHSKRATLKPGEFRFGKSTEIVE